MVVCGGRCLARRLYRRHRHPLARGTIANSLLATERRAETLRDPRPDGSPVLWAMTAANVEYHPTSKGARISAGGQAYNEAKKARKPSKKQQLEKGALPCPRTSKGGGKRSRILPEVCFILILLFQDPM